MSFSLVAAWIIFGILGMYVFRNGRKQSNAVHIGVGLALMTYPYVVTTALWNWLIGLGLLIIVYFTR